MINLKLWTLYTKFIIWLIPILWYEAVPTDLTSIHRVFIFNHRCRSTVNTVKLELFPSANRCMKVFSKNNKKIFKTSNIVVRFAIEKQHGAKSYIIHWLVEVTVVPMLTTGCIHVTGLSLTLCSYASGVLLWKNVSCISIPLIVRGGLCPAVGP